MRLIVKYYDPWTKEILAEANYCYNPRLASKGRYSNSVRKNIKFLSGMRKAKVEIRFL